jgi:molecular chaperone GrpE
MTGVERGADPVVAPGENPVAGGETEAVPSPARGAGATGPGTGGADAAGAAAPAADPVPIEDELAEARRLAEEHWDRYLRAEADLDNVRRRARRQADEALRQQRRDLLLRFLPVADNLERALAHAASDPQSLMAGVEGTYRELARVLALSGVAAIEAQDAPFDPALHEAVSVVPLPPGSDERVVAVELPGYLMDGELLRPARVIVGQPPATVAPASEVGA